MQNINYMKYIDTEENVERDYKIYYYIIKDQVSGLCLTAKKRSAVLYEALAYPGDIIRHFFKGQSIDRIAELGKIRAIIDSLESFKIEISKKTLFSKERMMSIAFFDIKNYKLYLELSADVIAFTVEQIIILIEALSNCSSGCLLDKRIKSYLRFYQQCDDLYYLKARK